MKKLLLLVLCSPSSAWAAGPFGTVGVLTTPAFEFSNGTVDGAGRLEPLFGPTARLGWEVGNYWNHEFALQFTAAHTTGEFSDVDLTVDFTTYAFGYRFAWEALGKKGFTPCIAIGLHTGYALLSAVGSEGTQSALATGGVPFVELNAAIGARYTLESGLNLRLDVAGSTYGGFFAIQPSLGVGYQL